MRRLFGILLLLFPFYSFSQTRIAHLNAHAHNDYEHELPLFGALKNGFTSVEADVHLYKGRLLIGHNRVSDRSPSLESLYFKPLDSILKKNDGHIYDGGGIFYLMLDIKTDAAATYDSIRALTLRFRSLCCRTSCGVYIFLSGNRPADILNKPFGCVGVDGRPSDLGRRYDARRMPVISDRYSNWSSWNGREALSPESLDRIRQLAKRVHAENKRLRLWAIPDNEVAWNALLEAGVDLINTDHLEELNQFLSKRGL